MSDTHRGQRTWTTYWQEMTPEGTLVQKGGGLIPMTQEQAWAYVRDTQLKEARAYDKAPGWWLSHYYTHHIIRLDEAMELVEEYPSGTGGGWRLECFEGAEPVPAT